MQKSTEAQIINYGGEDDEEMEYIAALVEANRRKSESLKNPDDKEVQAA